MTTDRVQAGAEGGFILLGRNDRIAKIEEKRVSLGSIEQRLLATGLLQEASALVLATAASQRVGVVAVPSPAGRALLEQSRKQLVDSLKQALTSTIEPVAWPRRWRFVAEMPHNAQGKTPQALLAALFEPSDAIPPVQWLSRTGTEARASLRVNAGLPLFKGHFDAAAILPGVAQLDWAIRLARQCFVLPEYVARLEALKFMRPIPPGTDLLLELYYRDDTTVRFSWTSSADADSPRVAHASGRVVWAEAPQSHA